MFEAVVIKKLRDYTLDIAMSSGRGEIVAIMGENGAGKSTTLNLISGILDPDAGSVRLGDTELFNRVKRINVPIEDRKIAYVAQNAAIFPHLTVSGNVSFGLRARHLPRRVIAERTGYWQERMNIADLSPVRAGNLSGGQRQRVALARAFATGPRLLMLDEPFTGLDPDATRDAIPLIREIVTELNIPCLLVTHRIADIKDIADRVFWMERGRNKWIGRPGDAPGDQQQPGVRSLYAHGKFFCSRNNSRACLD
jgi:molybdate transport system ATP-binding protein